jgi:histidyl-tRNA synthetase
MPLSGFPELLPSQRFVEQVVLDRLRAVFELHGFASIETPAAESLEQLLRKGEIDKEVYLLRRLHADEGDVGDAGLGLHFDLTVPFARYVLENAGHLHFPFRRYQIQKVWRGERPQAGRYREFTQADIDVIGRDQLPFHHDVEIARVMAEALAALDFLPALRLQINNRKLLEGFFRAVGVGDVVPVLRAVDRLDKVRPDAVAEELTQLAGLSEQQAAQCLALARICTPDESFGEQVRAITSTSNELLDAGIDELTAVMRGCAEITGLTVEADLRIARGLDYYTGTVFETRMSGYESLGSICSGGRYDSLASDSKATYPGVGISLGVTRMLVPLFQAGALDADRPVPSAVLVALPDEQSREDCTAIAQALRARGIPCEVAPEPRKFGRQIRFAEQRGIPFVWFPGQPDEVKDIRSGDQIPADADSWRPPENDLRPQVISQKVGQ